LVYQYDTKNLIGLSIRYNKSDWFIDLIRSTNPLLSQMETIPYQMIWKTKSNQQ